MKTNKELSVDQENFVASALDGRRTRASGAAKHDPGDVITLDEIVECKVTRKNSITLSLKTWKKIVQEAHTGKKPLMAFRFVDENDNPIVDLVMEDLNDYMTDTRMIS